MVARIFLCHGSEDKEQVEAIYDRLRERGFEPWMDKKDLIPGQRWQQEIPRALRASSLVLVCLSNHVGRPGYVQREFKLTLDALQEIPDEMIHTIPVRLEPCDIPGQFAFLHCCDLFAPDGFEKLVEAIRYGLEQRSSGASLVEERPSESRQDEAEISPQGMPRSSVPTSVSEGASKLPAWTLVVLAASALALFVLVYLVNPPALVDSSSKPAPEAVATPGSWREQTIEQWLEEQRERAR